MLDPEPMGGNFSFEVWCTAGCNAADSIAKATAIDLTFGDVYVCSGQSNMWLPLGNTFSRNRSFAKVQQGQCVL